jgi:transcription elongation factor/antiterminator RfaH
MSYAIVDSPTNSQWFAVWTRSRQEKTSAAMLEALGVPHFLPLIKDERQWSDRRKMVTVPLFPGYLFVQIARSSGLQLCVRKVPGVVNFVGNQNGPLAVPENEIHNVRALLSRGAVCSPCPFLKAGDRVRVVRGALAGIEGLFIRCGARSRVVVSVEIIQQSVSVDVPACDVELVRHIPQRESYSVFAPLLA